MTKAHGRAAPRRSPNILLIIADDLGPQLGCYGDTTTTQTPHLDRPAARGCRFTRGNVTQPSCSASRSSILTGVYPRQTGQIGLANRGSPDAMNPGTPTLPAILRDAGYRTGIIGKLHVNPDDAFVFDYARKGAPPTRHARRADDQVAEFLAQSPPNPFFLYVKFVDPHGKFVDSVDGLPGRLPLKKSGLGHGRKSAPPITRRAPLATTTASPK